MDKRIIYRFEDKIEFGNDDECWIWTGAKTNSGAGLFAINERKYVQAHRFMYELQTGKKLSREVFTRHLCENKLCVNPKHLEVRDDEFRFWQKVNKLDVYGNFCWEWTGGLRGGYGRFSVSGHSYPAHRYSYELHNDVKLSDDVLILHFCHNRLCVNPSHLRIGDHQENMQDMVDAGRSALGSKNGFSKLAEEDVLEIKQLLRDGEMMKVEIAEKFSISKSTIADIDKKRTWSWLNVELKGLLK